MPAITLKIEIPHAETVQPANQSGEIRFHGLINGFACSVYVPAEEGMEKETWERIKE